MLVELVSSLGGDYIAPGLSFASLFALSVPITVVTTDNSRVRSGAGTTDSQTGVISAVCCPLSLYAVCCIYPPPPLPPPYPHPQQRHRTLPSYITRSPLHLHLKEDDDDKFTPTKHLTPPPRYSSSRPAAAHTET